jgi:cephalosporin hydroxylase
MKVSPTLAAPLFVLIGLSVHGPGPMEAVEESLASDGRFAVDPSRERLMLTSHHEGYLKRVK